MKKHNSIIILTTLLFLYNCTSTRELSSVNISKKISTKIDLTIGESKLKPNIGINIISLNTGKTLYTNNADHLFIPASNNKLYTAAAAVHYLSPQFKYSTTVLVDSTYRDSAQIPRIVLVGGGDPDIFLPELELIAQAIGNQYSSIDTLIIDNSLFDDVDYGPGWMWDEGSAWYTAHVDAMSFNDNCIDITIAPGDIGEKPQFSLNPPTKYVQIINNAVTVNDTVDFKELDIERKWQKKNNVIEIKGEILFNEEDEIYYRNIENPALYTGTVLKELLAANGIDIKFVILGSRNSDKLISHYVYYSEVLSKSIDNFLKASDNLSGENYVKMIGSFISGEQGTWNNGMLAVKTFINDTVEIDTTQFSMVDGSGMSRYNLTSPQQLTSLLSYMYLENKYRKEFLSALPVGGINGTLENRMKNVENIYAKTGTMSGVSCLSGYAFTKSGEPLAFSIMMNGYLGSSKPYRDLQDRICEILVNY